jgi:cytochrome c-type biogenesis protein CcsB
MKLNCRAKRVGPVFLLLSLVAFFIGSLGQAASPIEPLKFLTVQDGGRLKPYDTFARETLQLVTGSQSYEGRSADEIVLTWMLVPEQWSSKRIIQINHHGLKESLKLDMDQNMFAPDELVANPRIGLVFQELQGKREAKEKLDPFYQAVARLQNQLAQFMAVRSGQAVHLVPGKDMSAPWLSVAELQGEQRDKFILLTKKFIEALPSGDENAESIAASEFKKSVEAFIVSARSVNPEAYGSAARIDVEVHYNSIHPFKWTWIFYLLSAILLGFALQTKRPLFYSAAWTSTLIAFAFHTYGFGLRVYLAGRPPVSNMYESVVWVSWGVVLFTGIFELINRRRFVLLAGNLVAVVCLIAADLAPAILDQSIQPLEPVLRSNLWLSVHVLTITLSYSAFFLAFGLGDVGLFYLLRGDDEKSERVRAITQSIYRAIQVGVVLLAAGTILGGVWADYSWGRFWGWDPKETWAFIALLGYIAVLHARLTGWLRNFGMIAAAVVSFSLVIMAWYGVNYVLGAGLHSYGFGAGGVQYVSAFVLLHLIYVGYVGYIMKARLKISDRS